jgi:hypothetical protein
MTDNLYEHITSRRFGEVGNYDFFGNEKGEFVQLQHHNFDPSAVTGWKIHLSVDPRDIAQATSILYGIYEKFGAVVFKVTDPEKAKKYNDPKISAQQAGKIFTLYDAGEKNWLRIIQAIENEFRQAAIRPGQPVVEDIRTEGSEYIYRRNDHSPDGEYVSAEKAAQINPRNPANPYNYPDPLRGLQLSHLFGASAEKIVREWFLRQNWQFVQSSREGHVMRADLPEMAEEQHSNFAAKLASRNVTAKIVHSKSFQKHVIQLGIKDYVTLRDRFSEKKMGISDYNWQYGTSPREGAFMRIDLGNLGETQRWTLRQNLIAHGIEAKVVHSHTFKRDFMQVGSEDLVKLLDIINAPPAAPAETTPGANRIARPGSGDTIRM